MTGKHIDRALAESFAAFPDIHEKWVKVQHRAAARAGAASITIMAQSTRADLLLRKLEAEKLEAMQNPQEEMIWWPDFMMMLSEAWLMTCYEVLRAGRQRTKSKGEVYPERLQSLLYKFELVRMAVSKGEIAKIKEHKGAPLILAHEDGSDAREYGNDGSYIIPRYICGQTGALMWKPIDIRNRTTVDICRRDLSDLFLEAFSD